MLFWIVSNVSCVIRYHNLRLLLAPAVDKYWVAAPASISGLKKTTDACTAVLKMHKRGELNLTVFWMCLVYHESCLIKEKKNMKKTNKVSNNYHKKIYTSEKQLMVILSLIFSYYILFYKYNVYKQIKAKIRKI